MTDDIVDRLRKGEGIGACLSGDASFADASMKAGAAEIERLRAALTDIRDTDIDIPSEDMLANVRATAALALARDNEQTTTETKDGR